MAEVEATLPLGLAIGAVLESPVPVPTSEQTIESNGNDSKLDESLNVIPENTVLETPIIAENAGKSSRSFQWIIGTNGRGIFSIESNSTCG